MGGKLCVSQIIDAVHSVYEENFRLLKTLDYAFPEGSGMFQIPKRLYTIDKRPGLSGAAGVILANQALVTFVVNAILNGDMPGVDAIDLSRDVSLRDVMEAADIRITNINVRYKKVISRDQPHTFHITFDKARSRKNIIFMKSQISFCDNSHVLSFSGCLDIEPFKQFSRA